MSQANTCTLGKRCPEDAKVLGLSTDFYTAMKYGAGSSLHASSSGTDHNYGQHWDLEETIRDQVLLSQHRDKWDVSIQHG